MAENERDTRNLPSPPGEGWMIRTVGLRIDYEEVTAVQDLNLSIARGEIYGLIGPNGAGKTSTIRALAALLEPTYGEVYIAGIDAMEHPEEAYKIIGYMPDDPPVYEELKVWEFLDLFAAAHFLPPPKRQERIDACLQMVNLESKRDALVGTLSRGMKQRLVLAKTLLHDPQVLLLDEPASGLDPGARIELREMLKRFGQMGKTILISSHILTELSDFCTSIGIMEKGSMVVSGPIEEIVTRMTPHKTLVVDLLVFDERAVALIERALKVKQIRVKGSQILVAFEGSTKEAAELLATLIQERIYVKAFYEHKTDIEDIFLKVGAREVS